MKKILLLLPNIAILFIVVCAAANSLAMPLRAEDERDPVLEFSDPIVLELFERVLEFNHVLPEPELLTILERISDEGVLLHERLAHLHAVFALRVRGIQPHHDIELVLRRIEALALAIQTAYSEVETDDDELLNERLENCMYEQQTILYLKDVLREQRARLRASSLAAAAAAAAACGTSSSSR